MQTNGFTAYGQVFKIEEGECVLFPSKDNRDWSTFQAPKKEHEFKTAEKVLVRDRDDQKWRYSLFSHKEGSLYVTVGMDWAQCIPYEGNEKLLGTTKNPEE